MALIVQKFGGSSVADVDRVRHVAGIITDTYKAGNDVVVVLSAQGKTTDKLLAMAEQYNPEGIQTGAGSCCCPPVNSRVWHCVP